MSRSAGMSEDESGENRDEGMRNTFTSTLYPLPLRPMPYTLSREALHASSPPCLPSSVSVDGNGKKYSQDWEKRCRQARLTLG